MNSSAYENNRGSVFEFMFGIILFTLIFTAASFLVAVTLKNYINELTLQKSSETVSASVSLSTVIIDPGHGGEDGGCSSGEVVEKDLNLQISQNIYDICTFMGVPAKMTRTEDTLLYDLYDDLNDYKGRKKTYDLKNRVRFANEENGGIYLGIHMNKFPQGVYKGLQVYYSPNNDDSQVLAEKIQSYTKTYLQPDNERKVKKSTNSIYILSKLDMPSVLVECGFLSNDSDVANLTDAAYQRSMALEIFSSVAEFAVSEK